MAPILATLLLGTVHADDLDSARTQRPDSGSFLRVSDADLDLEEPNSFDDIPMADLSPVADFHPETDRWTERNNRIRITLWTGVWHFSGEMDIHTDVPVGVRLNWEVPGFIGIRWDSGAVPWARMEVKGNPANPRSSRWMSGVVHNHTLSLGIFNPELSVDGLAFWAGFGGGLWVYNFAEDDVFGEGSGIDARFEDANISGHVFIEFDYEIADTFHIGIGIRQHFVLAEHTNDGRFYELNGQEQTNNLDRNEGQFDDLAAVFEATFNISILF